MSDRVQVKAHRKIAVGAATYEAGEVFDVSKEEATHMRDAGSAEMVGDTEEHETEEPKPAPEPVREEPKPGKPDEPAKGDDAPEARGREAGRSTAPAKPRER